MLCQTDVRVVRAHEEKFTCFVLKIQANVDPRYQDRVAFCGSYPAAIKRV